MGKAADCDKLNQAVNAQQETLKKAKTTPPDYDAMASAFENSRS